MGHQVNVGKHNQSIMCFNQMKYSSEVKVGHFIDWLAIGRQCFPHES
uniref:Uncharacterized protein n=1 Tax=Manihot esculenta TaxID=3983 RepID=A0A2C9W651_MANES